MFKFKTFSDAGKEGPSAVLLRACGGGIAARRGSPLLRCTAQTRWSVLVGRNRRTQVAGHAHPDARHRAVRPPSSTSRGSLVSLFTRTQDESSGVSTRARRLPFLVSGLQGQESLALPPASDENRRGSTIQMLAPERLFLHGSSFAQQTPSPLSQQVAVCAFLTCAKHQFPLCAICHVGCRAFVEAPSGV